MPDLEESPLPPEMSAEFDAHAQGYLGMVDAAVKFANESTIDFARQKVELMLAASKRLIGDPQQLQVLDVGCGTGIAEPFLRGRVKHVVAGDVSSEMVAEARSRCSGVDFVHLAEKRLPFDDNAFDVQFCYCVYHHVPLTDRRGLVAEIARVVRPGGLVFVFEHNPYNPLTRKIVRDCPLDRDAVLLRAAETRDLMRGAGLEIAEQRYYLFFPKFLAFLRPLEPLLGWLPLGGQYYVAARKPG